MPFVLIALYFHTSALLAASAFPPEPLCLSASFEGSFCLFPPAVTTASVNTCKAGFHSAIPPPRAQTLPYSHVPCFASRDGSKQRARTVQTDLQDANRMRFLGFVFAWVALLPSLWAEYDLKVLIFGFGQPLPQQVQPFCILLCPCNDPVVPLHF